MHYDVKAFGTLETSQKVQLYVLENDHGMKTEIINYGGIIKSVYIPDKNGNVDDVVLGKDTLEDYLDNDAYLGAIIGRYANRIEGHTFTLNGKVYTLADNNNGHCLHGGRNGFDKKYFQAEICKYNDRIDLILQAQSPDMEENFPGNLDMTVTYSLTNDNSLKIKYRAVSDKDTIINLTNHSYFNLRGHGSGTILDHVLQMNASFYMPGSETVCPTGEILSVDNTPFDFRKPKTIGQNIQQPDIQLMRMKGYDHNFVIDGTGFRKACSVYDPSSGRTMDVFTDMPGIQIYTGNYLGDTHAQKNGSVYADYQGMALETQLFPNAVKHPHFPSPVYRAGAVFESETVYTFRLQ